MSTLLERKIGEIVSEDFRTAAVFTKHRMDFCCGGHKTVREVCDDKKIDSDSLTAELNTVLNTKAENQIDFQSWPLDLLTSYIEKTHHRYVKEKTPLLLQYLNKLCQVHGDRHPELFEIQRHFLDCGNAMADHMEKEEVILFPFVNDIEESNRRGSRPETPPFGSVNNPINMMMHEHETEGERFRKIAELSDEYTPPADACGTYRVTFAMLQEFEQDLFKHIHLENNILFPRAIALESA